MWLVDYCWWVRECGCMRACVCVCVCACTGGWMCVCVSVWEREWLCAVSYAFWSYVIYIYFWLRVFVGNRMWLVCMRVFVCVCVCVCVCMWEYVSGVGESVCGCKYVVPHTSFDSVWCILELLLYVPICNTWHLYVYMIGYVGGCVCGWVWVYVYVCPHMPFWLLCDVF